jgi:hypothetical protein
MEKGGPFSNFFDALEFTVLSAIKNKKRLIIRSHPDEIGGENPSKYTINQFLTDKKLIPSEYVENFDSTQKWDPYKLAHCSEGTIVYNGTLAMELSALGYNVYNLANSNYCNKGFTFDIQRKEDVDQLFKSPIKNISSEQQEIAFKYLYFYFFISSVEMGNLIDEYQRAEYRFNNDGDLLAQITEFKNITERVKLLLSE